MTIPFQQSSAFQQDIRTCLGHDGLEEDQGGAMAPPIAQTSLFAKESHQELVDALSNEFDHNVYSRGQNPTVEAMERKIALLERGESCKCLASGMAAVAAALFGTLKQGDHVLFVNHIYGPTRGLARRLRRYGVEFDVLLEPNAEKIRAQLKENTRVIYFESPGTMLFRTVSIAEIVEVARAHGALTMIDNTWATPLFQKPLSLGVDLVIHSVTKYIAGHSDVVAGAIIGKRELIQTLFYDAYLLLGGALGPMDAWLAHRGLRTLPSRMLQHQADGLAVARFLSEHPRVRRVFHPSLDPESEDLLGTELLGTSGLFSFELATDSYEQLCAFLDALTLFKLGVSWGGVESLAIAPFRGNNSKGLAAQGMPPGLVRLSVGLEGPQLLIEDLIQALEISR